MKIVIVSSAYPLRGGIAHSAGLLYKELAKEHETILVYLQKSVSKFFISG
jgi:hypothetical protein